MCDHYGEYVDHLNSLDAKQKKEQNDKKFQERVILNEKEGFWEKLLSFFQKYF